MKVRIKTLPENLDIILFVHNMYNKLKNKNKWRNINGKDGEEFNNHKMRKEE